MRSKIRKLIEKEAEKFFEFPSDKKDVVTYTSCKFFAEHIYGLVNKELEETNAKLKFIYDECDAKFYYDWGDMSFIKIDEDCWDTINWKDEE